jgi:hypothetical protein
MTMTNEPVSRDEYKGRTALCDERFQDINKRQNKLEDAFQISSMLDVKFGLLVEQVLKKQDEQEQRMCSLEQKPAKKWELAVGALIGALVAAVVGFISSMLKGVGA